MNILSNLDLLEDFFLQTSCNKAESEEAVTG